MTSLIIEPVSLIVRNIYESLTHDGNYDNIEEINFFSLPIEIIQLIVYELKILSIKDVRNLCLTCKDMNYVLHGEVGNPNYYDMSQHYSLMGVHYCVKNDYKLAAELAYRKGLYCYKNIDLENKTEIYDIKQSTFLFLCQNGYLKLIEDYVKNEGVDHEYLFELPLRIATYNNHYDVVEYFVKELDADVNMKVTSSIDETYHARYNGHRFDLHSPNSSVSEFFLEDNNKYDFFDISGRSCFDHIIYKLHNVDMLKLVYENSHHHMLNYNYHNMIGTILDIAINYYSNRNENELSKNQINILTYLYQKVSNFERKRYKLKHIKSIIYFDMIQVARIIDFIPNILQNHEYYDNMRYLTKGVKNFTCDVLFKNNELLNILLDEYNDFLTSDILHKLFTSSLKNSNLYEIIKKLLNDPRLMFSENYSLENYCDIFIRSNFKFNRNNFEDYYYYCYIPETYIYRIPIIHLFLDKEDFDVSFNNDKLIKCIHDMYVFNNEYKNNSSNIKDNKIVNNFGNDLLSTMHRLLNDERIDEDVRKRYARHYIEDENDFVYDWY